MASIELFDTIDGLRLHTGRVGVMSAQRHGSKRITKSRYRGASIVRHTPPTTADAMRSTCRYRYYRNFLFCIRVDFNHTEFIIALNDSIVSSNDHEGWVGTDMLMKVTSVEVWHKPHFDEPTFVILLAGMIKSV